MFKNLTRHNRIQIKKQAIFALILYTALMFSPKMYKIPLIFIANYTIVNIAVELYFNERTHNNITGYKLLDIPYVLTITCLYFYISGEWALSLFN